jgi:hypothetical protein
VLERLRARAAGHARALRACVRETRLAPRRDARRVRPRRERCVRVRRPGARRARPAERAGDERRALSFGV